MNREQIKELALANGFKLKAQPDGGKDLNPYVYEFAQALMAQAAATNSTTPAAEWREAGKEDPHGSRYDCERAALAMGSLTDDQLANAVFSHDHRDLDLQAILAGEPSSIGLLTAAKDRIRWLSRSLAKSEQECHQLKEIQFVSQCEEVDVIRCLKTLAYEHNHADVPRYQALAKNVMDKYVERGAAAKASLAAHDADVIERFCAWLKANSHLDKTTHDGAVEYINQLRQQAKEVQS